MLVYAKGEEDPVVHNVRNSGKRLEVAALDLCGALDDVLRRVADLAQSVRRLPNEALQLRQAA